MSIALTHDTLLDYLRGKNFEPEIQSETKQIVAEMIVGREKHPFFVKMDSTSGIIQLLVFLPYELKPSAAPDVARLLLYCNKEIDLPGFGVDETANVVFYRCVLVGTKDEIAIELLDKVITAIPKLCEAFFPLITMAMGGKIKFDTILEKAKLDKSKSKR